MKSQSILKLIGLDDQILKSCPNEKVVAYLLFFAFIANCFLVMTGTIVHSLIVFSSPILIILLSIAAIFIFITIQSNIFTIYNIALLDYHNGKKVYSIKNFLVTNALLIFYSILPSQGILILVFRSSLNEKSILDSYILISELLESSPQYYFIYIIIAATFVLPDLLYLFFLKHYKHTLVRYQYSEVISNHLYTADLKNLHRHRNGLKALHYQRYSDEPFNTRLLEKPIEKYFSLDDFFSTNDLSGNK